MTTSDTLCDGMHGTFSSAELRHAPSRLVPIQGSCSRKNKNHLTSPPFFWRGLPALGNETRGHPKEEEAQSDRNCGKVAKKRQRRQTRAPQELRCSRSCEPVSRARYRRSHPVMRVTSHCSSKEHHSLPTRVGEVGLCPVLGGRSYITPRQDVKLTTQSRGDGIQSSERHTSMHQDLLGCVMRAIFALEKEILPTQKAHSKQN